MGHGFEVVIGIPLQNGAVGEERPPLGVPLQEPAQAEASQGVADLNVASSDGGAQVGGPKARRGMRNQRKIGGRHEESQSKGILVSVSETVDVRTMLVRVKLAGGEQCPPAASLVEEQLPGLEFRPLEWLESTGAPQLGLGPARLSPIGPELGPGSLIAFPIKQPVERSQRQIIGVDPQRLLKARPQNRERFHLKTAQVLAHFAAAQTAEFGF